MPSYMMVYKGEATDMADMSPDQVREVMGKWAAWIEGLGAALRDVGTPFGPASSLVDDGSDGVAVALSGYSIVEADDMDGARRLADGHPYLSDGRGNYAIDIYEMMPVPLQD